MRILVRMRRSGDEVVYVQGRKSKTEGRELVLTSERVDAGNGKPSTPPLTSSADPTPNSRGWRSSSSKIWQIRYEMDRQTTSDVKGVPHGTR